MNSNGVDILVVVDVQNDFVTGALGSEAAAAKTDAISEKARDFEGTVLLTQDTHSDDYLATMEGEHLPVPHCVKGTWGWQLTDDLAALAEEKGWRTFEKPTFASKELADFLVALNAEEPIRSIELIGFCTDICVISNALMIKGVLPEVPISVNESLCAATSDETQAASLLVLRSNHIDIV